MPQRCSIPGCKTGYKQGLMLLCYPKDPGRRSAWIEGVRKAGLEPTNMQFICELHFGPDQWEKIRVDGTRKLKWSGVPNMFTAEDVAKTLEIVRSVSEMRQHPRGPVKRKGSEETAESKAEAKPACVPTVIRRVVKLDKICKSIETPLPTNAVSKIQLSSVSNSTKAAIHSTVFHDELIESSPSVLDMNRTSQQLLKSPSTVVGVNSDSQLSLKCRGAVVRVNSHTHQSLKSHGTVVNVNSHAQELLKPQNPIVNVTANKKQTSYVESRLPLSSPSHSIVVKLPKSRFQNSLVEDLEDVRSFLSETESTYEQRLINAVLELTKKHQLFDEKLQNHNEVLAENSVLKEKLKDHEKVLIENYTLKEKLRKYEQRSIVDNVFLKEKLGVRKGTVIKIKRVEGTLRKIGTIASVSPNDASDENVSSNENVSAYVSLDEQL